MLECGAIFSIRDNFTNRASSIINATERIRSNVNNCGNTFERCNGRIGSTGSRLGTLASRFRSAGSGAERGSRGVRNFNSSLHCGVIDKAIGKLKKLGAAYLGFQGLKKLGGEIIGGAANWEQYRNTLNVVMGDSKKAGETFRWAVDFANRTPYNTEELISGTAKLQSYGISAKDTMTDIGNMSSVMGKSLESGIEAINLLSHNIVIYC